MTRKFLLNPFEEADRQVLEQGHWVVATVYPQMSWPEKRQIVEFEGKDFVLLPQSPGADQNAAIAFRTDGYALSVEEARCEVMRFCSALSWSEGSGLSILAWGGGNLPRPIGVRRGRIVRNFLDPEHLPSTKTSEERAAIALYREGVSLDNPFYAFLSLYKVVSVLLPKGKARVAWIADALDRLDDHRAKVRCEELRNSEIDVGLYLFKECRCAIAHAEQEPFVNPDEVDDHFRLTQDIPLLRNLAELAIEENSSLNRSHTLWRDHLYELAGFRNLLADELIEMLVKSEPIPEGTTVDLPERYTVLARREAEVYSFQDMIPEIAGQVEGGVVFDLVSEDGAIRIRTVLSFADERLKYDPSGGFGFTPNRDDPKFIQYEINYLLFSRCILSNGHLEIWDQEEELMLGRSETCIPVNCFVNPKYYESELSLLENLLENNDQLNSDNVS
jgi:hypothetical protein